MTALQTPSEALALETAEHFSGLVRWACAQRDTALPPEVMRCAALALGDDLAAAVAARDEPQVRAAQEQQLTAGASPEATVFRGGRPRTDRYRAAVANGLAMPWVELDEGYRRAITHSALYAVPALVAEAEATALTVREVLVCLALAYEICSRMAVAFPFPPMRLHPHAARAAVASAAAVALARGESPEVATDAISAAIGFIAVGPYRHAIDGALVRNVWTGASAWHGMRAVDLARCGIGGLPSAPYDVFSVGLGAQAFPARLSDGLGAEWAILDGYHKIYACCQYAHSAVESILALIAEHGKPEPEAIESVDVETSDLGMSLLNYAPATLLAAKFSMPHCIAATLYYGNAGPQAFATSTLSDARLSALRERVVLRLREPALPWPNDRPASVHVKMRDGRMLTHETLSARGGPDRPFSEDDLIAKMHDLCSDVYPQFAPLFRELVEGRADVLDRSWSDLITAFAGAS